MSHPLLNKINTAMCEDQGNAYKAHLKQALLELEDPYKATKDNREHLGASVISKECKRAVWYNFRWVHKTALKANTIRLFNRGHLEEARFIALLRSIGIVVYTMDSRTNRQYGFIRGLYRGSCDSIIFCNHSSPYWMCEFKTHNDQSFNTLQARGVKKAKIEHYDQMQILMYEIGLQWCLYMAVNKNNDELYFEDIECKPEIGERYRVLATEIITSDTPPPPCDPSPSFWKCKWCDYYQLCKFNNKTKIDKNCRTCNYCTFDSLAEKQLCTHKQTECINCSEYVQKEAL